MTLLKQAKQALKNKDIDTYNRIYEVKKLISDMQNKIKYLNNAVSELKALDMLDKTNSTAINTFRYYQNKL